MSVRYRNRFMNSWQEIQISINVSKDGVIQLPAREWQSGTRQVVIGTAKLFVDLLLISLNKLICCLYSEGSKNS